MGVTAEPALPLTSIAAGARAFPALWDTAGERIAGGSYTQWAERGRLHVRIRYDILDGRVFVENAAFVPGPPLAQTSWSWTESRGRDTLRHFEADLEGGVARSAERNDDGEVDRDEGEIDVRPGVTFAGFGFTLALQALRERLIGGEVVPLEAVAFASGPRVVDVEVAHRGQERMRMGGLALPGDRFDIVAQIPWYFDLFVDVPTTHIWLTRGSPSEFLRWEGPLVEPGDPVVRVDMLPGAESGPAEAIAPADVR
ncbi:MAG TPA: hypothetical protein VFQ22_12050 [Longimicrobiales bacterium]|nr:hypothetical protein [Longimicrobiales bacterium]